ncbi:hypothetical protein FGO68_gene6440 [Halteria grandinella]|uniref:Uncharacterized protein n=1 Tax=Halteria grandinella TaxID=5974 RepID=A0A8J8P5R1_HALGN|nr:hypothetical protein FGO68_gene6440 [Halteria grandinella]
MDAKKGSQLRLPLQEKPELSAPIVLSEKSNQAAKGKLRQPMEKLMAKNQDCFAEPMAFLAPRRGRGGRKPLESQASQTEDKEMAIKMEAGQILNDPEAFVPIFQKSSSTPQQGLKTSHPSLIPIQRQVSEGGQHIKSELSQDVNSQRGEAIIMEDKKKWGVDQQRKLKDIKDSDQEVNRQTVASSTINIKNHMTNEPKQPFSTTNQPTKPSQPATPDASAQKLLEDLEYALSGSRGVTSSVQATPQPQPVPQPQQTGSASSSSEDDDDDEEEMMADDGDDGNIQSMTAGGGQEGGAPGSSFQGRWTQEEHDKFIEGLQLFGCREILPKESKGPTRASLLLPQARKRRSSSLHNRRLKQLLIKRPPRKKKNPLFKAQYHISERSRPIAVTQKYSIMPQRLPIQIRIFLINLRHSFKSNLPPRFLHLHHHNSSISQRPFFQSSQRRRIPYPCL